VAPQPAPAPQPTTQPHTKEQKLEASATLGAYNELGPEYQDAVVESFLSRMDRLNAQSRPPMPGPYPVVPVMPTVPAKKSKSGGINIATLVICLAMAIPLTAIAASYGGFLGMILAWVGVVLVAFITQRGRDKD